MVAGYFNAISDVSEKVGGRPPKIQDLESFNAMINDCGIIDCGYEGSKYTWSNNQEWGLCSVSFDPFPLGPTSISIYLAQLQRMLYLDPRLGYYQFGHGGMGSCKRNSKL